MSCYITEFVANKKKTIDIFKTLAAISDRLNYI